jgi:hypothetical protein
LIDAATGVFLADLLSCCAATITGEAAYTNKNIIIKAYKPYFNLFKFCSFMLQDGDPPVILIIK